MKMIKVKRTEIVEPLFKIGGRAMLKENLLVVEIKDISVKKGRYEYKVFYPHLPNAMIFNCDENELEVVPFDYNQKIFNAYIEYRSKYYELLERLMSPSLRKKY